MRISDWSSDVCSSDLPDGYACVRVDSRGAGRSPGVMDCWSPRETEDFAQCIEWAGTREWSNGRVGLNGISYYGMNQWWVAGRQPKHLAAMRSEEHTSELQSLMRIPYAVFCLKKK